MRSRRSTQGAVQSLVADHGPRARQHLAYQALGEWTPEQREAIRTLAAASPEVRAQAFADGSGVDGGVRRERRPASRRQLRPRRRDRCAVASRQRAGEWRERRRELATPQDQPPPDRGGGS